MKKAIEVTIEGEIVGLLQARSGEPVGVHIGNIPKDHMRVWASGSDDEETWYWQIPDVPNGKSVSFRIVDANENEISKPHKIEKRDPEEVLQSKKKANEMYKQAMKEQYQKEKNNA